MGCLTAGTTLWAGTAHASLQLAAAGSLLTNSVSQQRLDEDAPEMQRLKVLDLCKRAREAMGKGELETADKLVAQAEAFNVSFPIMHFGDTPKKVRKELEKSRPMPSAKQLPSDRFAPVTASDEDARPSQTPVSQVSDARGTLPTAESPEAKFGAAQAQAKQYLTKGRAELAKANVMGASHWCEKAIQTGVTFAPNEDSPEKLAIDIQRAGGEVNAAASATASPGGATANNPFARQQAMTPPTDNEDTPSLLKRESWPGNTPATMAPPGSAAAPTSKSDLLAGPSPVQPAAQMPVSTSASPTGYPVARSSESAVQSQTRAQSDGLLWAARRALAVGDVRRATESVAQAKGLNVQYEFHEDSPAKVEAAIGKYADLSQVKDRDSEGYRKRYADLQMQQAEDLLRWRDFDEAERLAVEAKRRGISYTPFENSPDNLLKRIAEARKKAPVAAVEALPRVENVAATAPAPTNNAVAAAPAAPANDAAKAQALQLVNQARTALNAGDLNAAENFARQAESLGVPDSAFGPKDDRAWLVLFQIEKAKRGPLATAAAAPPMPNPIQQTGAIAPIDTSPTAQPPAVQALYNPQNDPTHNVPASAAGPVVAPTAGAGTAAGQTVGVALFLQGEEALRRHDSKTAQALFREAANHRTDLDAAMQQRLQDRLQLVVQTSADALPTPADHSMLNDVHLQHQLRARQASDELNRQVAMARQLQESDPKQAAAVLEQARAMVERLQLDTPTKDMLLRRLDRNVDELNKYTNSNKARIELDEKNRAIKGDFEREQQVKVEVQEKIALLVNEFNDLMDQRRWAEAELVAKRAFELAPREPVVMQIKRQAQFTRSNQNNLEILDAKRDGFVRDQESILRASIPMDADANPIEFGKNWDKINERSKRWLASQKGHLRSEREIEIEQRLKTPVSLQFKDATLEEVMKYLAKLANVSIYLDPRGLTEEAVDTSTPVTINLEQEITLKSALSLILEPLHLSYVIKDEVLKITSEQLRDGEVYTVTYNVADLVIPIPNFMPSGKMGLAGALADAQAGLNPGGPMGAGGTPLAAMATPDGGSMNAMVDPKILAQFGGGNMPLNGFGRGGGGATGMPQNIPFGGPGGMGGGVQPDFESLIELITATIAPTTWSDVGGAGAVKQFAGNLSLVISQTQEVHEQISDLLEQLRRLQDLQVTIEVRFISLSDTFYEKMGVQFDANLPTYISPAQSQAAFVNNGTANTTNPAFAFNSGNSVTAGLTNPQNPVAGFPAGQFPTFTNDLDVPFTQNSFSQTLPTQRLFNYAGVGASGGATLGFALLSELEAYFFIEAVQNDIRTNVLQAPKVTLFNGQQAFVSDTTQSPFVISVIPVVGDFAAAQQPVIVVLSEGTFLTVQAVVSADRRFVRLTVVPFFSQIGKVNTFTFTGASSNTRASSSGGPEGAELTRTNAATSNTSGTTVQLPQFAFQTVTTTVSVPDGGTVLLGGIKRLSEERKEDGVPILNKLPYVNRLFNNISTGRTTSSLMMMVTPRIIIQEEEERLLGVQPNSP
jgi:general secretion pathway protein D